MQNHTHTEAAGETTIRTERVLAQLRDAFGRLDQEGDAAIDDLGALYHDQVVFQDPLVHIEGREAFVALNRRLLRRARILTVRVGASAAAGEDAFLGWEMDYAFKLGPMITIVGTSHFRIRDGLVVSQRDYWDLLSSMIDRVPGAGRVYHAIAARVA